MSAAGGHCDNKSLGSCGAASALRAVAGTGVGSRIYEQRHILHVAQHTRHRDNLLDIRALQQSVGVCGSARARAHRARFGMFRRSGVVRYAAFGSARAAQLPVYLHSGAVRRGLVPALYLPSASQSARRFKAGHAQTHHAHRRRCRGSHGHPRISEQLALRKSGHVRH